MDSCESCVQDALHNATCAPVYFAVWEFGDMIKSSQAFDPVECSTHELFPLRAVLRSPVFLITVKHST
jgi:hypothetical protein